jgi:hypothetical protein
MNNHTYLWLYLVREEIRASIKQTTKPDEEQHTAKKLPCNVRQICRFFDTPPSRTVLSYDHDATSWPLVEKTRVLT